MSEWKTYRLGEIIELKRGYDLPDYNRLPGNIPVYTSAGLSSLHNEAKVKGPGVITGRYGTLGEIYYSENNFWPHNTTLYVKNFKGNDPKFIYYFLRTLRLASGNDKSSVPGLNRNDLHNFTVTIPSLATQRQIAQILSSLDDKIELNLQMNQTLEAMAQAIFKEWFVDFNYPKSLNRDSPDLHDEQDFKKENQTKKNQGNQENPKNQGSDNGLPKGWRMGKLGEEFNLTMGQSPKGESLNQENEGMIFYQGRTDFGFRFPTNRVFTTEPNRIANKLDTLVCVRAPVGDVNMAIEKCCIGRGLSAVIHKSNAYSYTYYLMKNIEPIFKGFESEGTVFGSLNKNNFENIEIIVPNINLVNEFEIIANSIDEKILTNQLQIQTLTQLRDTLLPKLMSGSLNLDLLDGQDSKDFESQANQNQGNQENPKNQD